MKILGIGNAIVDVLCKVSDDFLIKNYSDIIDIYQRNEQILVTLHHLSNASIS